MIDLTVKKLRKDIFIRCVCGLVLILFVVRMCRPEVNTSRSERAAVADSTAAMIAQKEVSQEPLQEVNAQEETSQESSQEVNVQEKQTPSEEQTAATSSTPSASARQLSAHDVLTTEMPRLDFSKRHPIRSVHSYRDCFPDVQDVQIVAAQANGVPPVESRADAERRKSELLYVGANPYYEIDSRMNRSIPYLVPRASHLLQHIGRRFLDSLAVKQIPLHKIIVTSVLRTEDDVRRLKRINGNASEQSCHRFGTTFDISYNRFHTVSPPGEPERRAVRNDSLKFVLSEVLRDIRAEGRCYVKYEVKQGCFHVTVR